MTTSGIAESSKTTLPVILLAAVVQGWALYALHVAITGSHWPATQPAWLLALYALTLFVPVTVQLVAEHVRRSSTWFVLGSMAALFFYFAWHHGAQVLDQDAKHFAASGEWFPMAVVLALLWLLMLPFIQCRLIDGRWSPRYEALFATAWRNKIALAEACLFTGLFWLLLSLWQALFKMLGIEFFSELFNEPIFVYPVTSLAFGCALHLIGSVDGLTSAVLEQLLNVLKWLAIVAGLILALFTIAMIFRLPGMISSGERAISAVWLLWLVAVTVLLVNAAYRDGSVDQPYPEWIALGLRCAIPLIVVIAITALYALYLRIDAYGFTIERVWACIVTAAACIYAAGYALAARSKGRWMAGVARVNVIAALFLIATISLALTPLISPYRISADSQFRLAQAQPPSQTDGAYGHDSPLRYLRFSAGEYGARKLRELSELKDHPRAAEIREAAAAMIAQQERWRTFPSTNLGARLAKLAVYPSGRSLDAALLAKVEADLRNPDLGWAYIDDDAKLGGVLVDLNGDEIEEFVLIVPPTAHAYEQGDGKWRRFAVMASHGLAEEWDVAADIAREDVHLSEPMWRELKIGRHTFRIGDTVKE
ncbi:MAG TPA: DUF4153 domain-containing protein [Steroidobacter sp.]|nr:DUF4153 domain-containing protein [Steroidobacter sp.]